ncbi:hypothetical protein CPB84DRAFT_1749717 [Gymnopilus junonius]|uniref:Uncharacterized protein n=1 Tax=Gymnopilus junonius TaxID=109634 RepID=A0A9P5TK46_GYMJU|nr:hypothetical protein CPB84DRAFT_1749717 [Gymnopilus junonius]
MALGELLDMLLPLLLAWAWKLRTAGQLLDVLVFGAPLTLEMLLAFELLSHESISDVGLPEGKERAARQGGGVRVPMWCLRRLSQPGPSRTVMTQQEQVEMEGGWKGDKLDIRVQLGISITMFIKCKEAKAHQDKRLPGLRFTDVQLRAIDKKLEEEQMQKQWLRRRLSLEGHIYNA